MGLNEFVDVPICHPFRGHCEFAIAHRRSQQRQHVRMVKCFPHYSFPAEPLRVNVSPLTCTVAQRICSLRFGFCESHS